MHARDAVSAYGVRNVRTYEVRGPQQRTNTAANVTTKRPSSRQKDPKKKQHCTVAGTCTLLPERSTANNWDDCGEGHQEIIKMHLSRELEIVVRDWEKVRNHKDQKDEKQKMKNRTNQIR